MAIYFAHLRHLQAKPGKIYEEHAQLFQLPFITIRHSTLMGMTSEFPNN